LAVSAEFPDDRDHGRPGQEEPRAMFASSARMSLLTGKDGYRVLIDRPWPRAVSLR